MRIAFSVNFLILCDIIGHYATNGGLCWLQQGREPACAMVLMRQVSFEECCGGSSLDKAWSNSSASINEVSLLGLLGMVPCRPCKGKSALYLCHVQYSEHINIVNLTLKGLV
uniref:TB domain-containing protein n=1 Tax=Paramormyrops kingsleyae TaxID=1676925 RepID=A0A3B3SFX0_9TELE